MTLAEIDALISKHSPYPLVRPATETKTHKRARKGCSVITAAIGHRLPGGRWATISVAFSTLELREARSEELKRYMVTTRVQDAVRSMERYLSEAMRPTQASAH